MIETISLSVLIALALSVDAFLACFAYGANQKCSKVITKAPIIIGAFHFVLPLLSFFCFNYIKVLDPWGKIISSMMFIFLGIICFIGKKEEEKRIYNIVGIIILSFSVSIDSLLVGVSLAFETNNIFIPALIFGLITAVISFISLRFSLFLSNKFKYNLDVIAGIFFIILGLITLLEVL